MLKVTGFIVISFCSSTVKFKDVYVQIVQIDKGERKLFAINQMRSEKKGANRTQTTVLQKIETPFSLRPAIGKKGSVFLNIFYR